MTNQEAYDRVKAHLLKQNKKAMKDDYGKCTYQTSDGLKCAIGALLPEHILTYEFVQTNHPISSLLDGICGTPEIIDHFRGVDPKLLNALQSVHDHHFPSDWAEKLKVIAERFELQP